MPPGNTGVYVEMLQSPSASAIEQRLRAVSERLRAIERRKGALDDRQDVIDRLAFETLATMVDMQVNVARWQNLILGTRSTG